VRREAAVTPAAHAAGVTVHRAPAARRARAVLACGYYGASGGGLKPAPARPEASLCEALKLGSPRLHVRILHRAVEVDGVAIGLFELVGM
jgi:hypothetical protein